MESTVHFFLHRPNLTTQRHTLLNKLESINASIMTENENSVVRTLLFGRPDFSYSTNKEIINVTISFILNERFNCPLLKLINSSKSKALQSTPYIFFHFSRGFFLI